jgi:hypothetical protein
MAGPYPHDQSIGGAGPPYADPRHSHPYPGRQPPAQPYPESAVPSAYPGMLPPPVQYPKRRRWPLFAMALLAAGVVAAAVVAVVFAVRGGDGGTDALTPAAAKGAIQDYLNALSDGDADKVARHTLCGMYDAVRDRKSDMALAELSSDAFRKQFQHTEVTSIDKMVFWSNHQTQVLFTMRAVPASGSSGGGPQPTEDDQAVAQILTQGNEILVCSYLLRVAGQY